MASLKERFEELIHMTWSEFLNLESATSTTVDDSTICALIRVCADTDKINSIKLAFDRVDGLMETPIEVKVPKFYTRYIKAKEIDGGVDASESAVTVPKEKKATYDPATAKLRETLLEMRSMPQQVVGLVLGHKQSIEEGNKPEHDPMVKSIIVANLIYNASKGNPRAVELLFDQIDGKLTRTITLLGGEDVYIDDFNTLKAPSDAVKDEDGYYIAENQAMTTQWIRGFSQSQKGLEILAEGLDD